MLKKAVFIVLLFFSGASVFSQVPEEEYPESLYKIDEFAIGVSGIYTEYPEFAIRNGYGLTLHLGVHENIALNWHLYFGKQYFSTSVWIPLGPLLALSAAGNGGGREALGLLLLSALPDGVSFPIRLNDKLYLTPTISPLNLDMFGKDPAYKRFYVNGNFALGFHIKGKYFNIHPYGALNLLYTRAPNVGFSAGLEIELRTLSF